MGILRGIVHMSLLQFAVHIQHEAYLLRKISKLPSHLGHVEVITFILSNDKLLIHA